MIVIVTGDRNWNRMDIIERELKKFPPGTTVFHGAARGADILSGFVADKLGFKVRPFKAMWNIYGRAAGPIRNQQMIDEAMKYKEESKCVLAFHENIGESKGTKDMVNRARGAGIKVEIFKK